MLQVLSDHDLLDADSVGVDGTTLEANAALKSIVRRKGGDSYKKYLKKLAKEMGIEEPTQEDLASWTANARTRAQTPIGSILKIPTRTSPR